MHKGIREITDEEGKTVNSIIIVTIMSPDGSIHKFCTHSDPVSLLCSIGALENVKQSIFAEVYPTDNLAKSIKVAQGTLGVEEKGEEEPTVEEPTDG
jgi:hypothetical protein